MTSADALTTPTDRILQHLALHQECSRGDLLDAAGVQSYPELDRLLHTLEQEQKITAQWHNLGFRTYQLVEVRPNGPFSWLAPKAPE